MKRICITGAGGMIGTALVQYALSAGTAVTALVRPGSGKLRTMRHPLLQVVEADLSALDRVQCAPCDAFVHLGWAATHGDARLAADTQNRNIENTLSAVRLAHRLGCSVFVFAGSQAEYGPQTAPLRADTVPHPQSAYGKAKLAAGEQSRALCRQLGMRHCHVRILSVFGIGDRKTTLISACMDAMRHGESPPLTDCTQMWDYIYADDAARALYLVLEKGKDGAVYPLGSGRCRPLRDYVLDIRAETGCAAEPRFGEKDFLPDQVHYLCADLSALTADTGFVPQVSFREGIRKIINDEEDASMKPFMDADFLLKTETAKKLFAAANEMPIFDWHCHLSPKEIYENRQPENITQLWLYGDHYKWRAMRSCGVAETYITGSASDYEKFCAFARVMPYLIGNPIYHWTHLELQRYFGIHETLSEKTAQQIWSAANDKIAGGGFAPRELIERSNVVCVCTTDDPADTLEYHALLQKETGFPCKVLPAFRPDKALNIELPTFLPWLKALEDIAGGTITSFAALKAVLRERIRFFDEMGCRASDQAFAYVPYAPADEIESELIFSKALCGKPLTTADADRYRTALLQFLAAEYAAHGWAMELHIGPMRNNNTQMFTAIGADTGFDSIGDDPVAFRLSRFLDSMDAAGKLPKTILFTLNPRDNYVIGSMLGNFQTQEAFGKMQFGSGWWFNDNIDGMRAQMCALANLGALGSFVGMVTDSRSFLSYPRHEYFRRILCDLLGDFVEQGLYPADMDMLCEIVRNISFGNAKRYFGLC